MSVEMMDGTWRDHIKNVLRLDAEEIPLWERIAESVPTHHLKHIIRMMIRREKEEMDSLRMLLDEHMHEPGYAPGPGMGPYPGPCPGYGPGYGYGPGFGPGPGFDPMPYSKKDKEEK
ncbi:MAG TPA: hypothetical protein GXX19_09270 [Syntrophomonadaceae bacterium]|nr:hypothetical protein [Syntrophomonadaceae bacterium]